MDVTDRSPRIVRTASARRECRLCTDIAPTFDPGDLRPQADSIRPQGLLARPRFSGAQSVVAAPRASGWFVPMLLATLLVALAGCRFMPRNAASDRLLASRQMTLNGVDALEQGRYEEAEALFGAAIRQCSVDERARSGYAEALWQRGASDLAIREMEKAIQLAPGNGEMLVRLGEMRLARGDQDGAIACANQALERHPHDATAWILLGDVQRSRHDLEDALASYHRALRCAPDSYHAQFAIADIYRQQNRPHRMLATLESLADNYAPDEVPAEVLVQKGLAQHDLGRFADAATTLATAARRSDLSPDLLVQLAETQLLANDAAGARMTAVEASRRFPDHARLQQLVAHLDSPSLHLAAARNDNAAVRH